MLDQNRTVHLARESAAHSRSAAARESPSGHGMNTLPFESEALRVNLARTQLRELQLPPEHAWLLSLSSDRHGIHARTAELMRELHHPFPNAETVVEQLRAVALSDLWFYRGSSEPVRALRTLLDVASRTLSFDLPSASRQRVLVTLLEGATSLLDQPEQEAYLPALMDLPPLLRTAMHEEPHVLRRASSFLKWYGATLGKHAVLGADITALLREALQTNLQWWEETCDPEAWFAEVLPRLRDPGTGSVRGEIASLKQLAHDTLVRAESWDDLQAVPDFNRFSETLRVLADSVSSPFDRAQYLLWVLQLPGTRDQSRALLSDLERVVGGLQGTADGAALERLIDDLFDAFPRIGAQGRREVLGCIETLGRVVHEWKHDELIDHFLDCTVRYGFTPPSIHGVNEQWQVQVDPHHLENLRAWLRLIEIDPPRSTALLSALIANLQIEGVFLSDTDLFQRDVSRLLQAPIANAYPSILQLGRLLPVYFQEVGAEGELRDVSTRMDELSERHDRLIHFLRKQVHAESNGTHIELARKVLAFWHSGDPAPLLRVLPQDVRDALVTSGPWFEPVHRIVTRLCELLEVPPEQLPGCPQPRLDAALESVTGVGDPDRQRVRLLLRLEVLLRQKYGLEAVGAVPALRSVAQLSSEVSRQDADQLEALLASEDPEPALEFVLDLMERLRDVIRNPKQTEAREEIYRKRHIAAGIPSMYGIYFEPKFAALGLTYRLESLATALMARLAERTRLRFVCFRALSGVARVLRLFRRGLALAGMASESFNSHLEMLEYSLKTDSFSLPQFINLFQFIADDVQQIIHRYFLGLHDPVLRVVIGQHLDRQPPAAATLDRERATHKLAEEFYRRLLSTSFLVAPLDNYVASVLEALHATQDQLPAQLVSRTMAFDASTLSSPVDEPTPALDNQVFLGAKGYFLKRMRSFGFPVPPGFILTTELFRLRDALDSYPQLRQEVLKLIDQRVQALEIATGKRLGDPERPLLLSVRSGAAISMHGAMNTFLNVGINLSVVERLSKQPNFGWTSWDCYRRSMQSWGMAHGISRDEFDRLILDFKRRYRVTQKVQFTPAQMREIALAYADLLASRGVHVEEDPMRQLLQAVLSVLDSWDNERSNVYRSRLRLAEEWGTAVIVQHMVLGNIGYDSGTGVLFTQDPTGKATDVCLWGDFTTTSQGEDVVGGLVHPWPVSKRQIDPDQEHAISLSLETHFPEIYDELLRRSRELVIERGFGHQEMEFTFESSRRQDLYILQTRPHTTVRPTRRPVFSGEGLDSLRVARGIGIGEGAMNGIVAFDMHDLVELARERPGIPRILVRPDTVPDDIEMIFECDGMLTARGGATSHAAVTAARLGKTCVVNCKGMGVDEQNKVCTIQGAEFRVGDPIGIDGLLGNVYRGHPPIAMSTVAAT